MLTEKQKRFVEEYLIDLNATQAAIRAGYSVKRASELGYQLLQKTTVSEAISKAMAERSRRTGITQDRIIRELAKVAFVNATDVINMDEATIRGEANRDDTAAIASVKVKTIPTETGEIVEREVKTYDKLKALELLGKHLGMFTDKISISGDIGVKIVDDITDE
jgi:phage terminase small subunit